MKPVRLSLQRYRARAMMALALMVFAQLALAVSGCFASRTASVGVESEHQGCATERLLCWTHCQADEQTHEPSSVSVWSVDERSAWLAPTFAALLESRPAIRWQRTLPLAAPPPTILLGRMLI